MKDAACGETSEGDCVVLADVSEARDRLDLLELDALPDLDFLRFCLGGGGRSACASGCDADADVRDRESEVCDRESEREPDTLDPPCARRRPAYSPG